MKPGIDCDVLNFSASFDAWVDSADAGRYDELSFFCTSESLPWYEPPAPPANRASTATAMIAKNGNPRGSRRLVSGAAGSAASTSSVWVMLILLGDAGGASRMSQN